MTTPTPFPPPTLAARAPVEGLIAPYSAIQEHILEETFQKQLVRYCDLLGLLCYHTHDSRRSVKGYPDFSVLGPSGHLYAELKKTTGRVTPEQRTWLARLNHIGIEVHIWRPLDLHAAIRRLHALAQTPQET
jgi:hypothetical protein